MSNIGSSTDLTPKRGMVLTSLDKTSGSPFLQNVIARNGEFLTRPGMGTVYEFGTTLNAARVKTEDTSNTFYGLGAPIGFTAIRTPWGSDQLLSVHPVYAFSGSLGFNTSDTALYGRRALYLAGVTVVVHDLHTGRHWEFVLHQQDAQSDDLQNVLPHYATRISVAMGTIPIQTLDASRWAVPEAEPQWAIFSNPAVDSGAVVIVIDMLGQWTYRPVDSPRQLDRKNDSLDVPVLGPNMGETCACSPLNMCNGALKEVSPAIRYLQPSEFAQPQAVGQYFDLTVYAIRNVLWFSDLLRPDNIRALNNYPLPTTDPVTLIATFNGNLFVASLTQCWVYQASTGEDGEYQTRGILTQVSTTVGCVNNRGYVLTDDGVYFMTSNGVYAYRGGTTLTCISNTIDRLWTDPQSLQMPLTDFYVKTGVTALASPQLPARYDIPAQTQNARLTWDQNHNTLYCTCDDVVLCWNSTPGWSEDARRGPQPFGWSVWYFQSHAGSPSQVQGVANIRSPSMLALRGDVYMVGGVDETVYSSAAPSRGPAPITSTARDKSCYLLKMGRGGALDRSMSATPAAPDVWAVDFRGYIVNPDVARLTIVGVPYVSTMQLGETIIAFAQRVALSAAGDANYTVLATATGVLCVQKPGGTVGPVIGLMISGVGSFIASNTQVAAAADVSAAGLEDQREPIGGWIAQRSGVYPSPNVFLGRPIRVPAGFITPSATTLAFESWWLPVQIGMGGTFALPSAFSIHFTFDTAKWTPILDGVVADVSAFDFVLPCERLASITGYLPGAMDATHQVRVYGAGVPAVNGDEVHIDFDGGAGAWNLAPLVALGEIGPAPVIMIGFRAIGATSFSVVDRDIAVAASATVAAVVHPANVYIWQEGHYETEQAALAAKQQPVDWLVKTVEARNNGLQIKMRGVFLTAMHFGKGVDQAVPGWMRGPLNTATSSDERDYAAQALDFTTTPPGNSEQNDIGVYPHLQLLTLSADPVPKVFGTAAKWGDTTDTSKGNLLIGDANVDTLATSDGSAGERISVMVHGTLGSMGESVRIGGVEGAIIQTGLRRRWK